MHDNRMRTGLKYMSVQRHCLMKKEKLFHKLIFVIRVFMKKFWWFSATHEIFLTSNSFQTTVYFKGTIMIIYVCACVLSYPINAWVLETSCYWDVVTAYHWLRYKLDFAQPTGKSGLKMANMLYQLGAKLTHSAHAWLYLFNA